MLLLVVVYECADCGIVATGEHSGGCFFFGDCGGVLDSEAWWWAWMKQDGEDRKGFDLQALVWIGVLSVFGA